MRYVLTDDEKIADKLMQQFAETYDDIPAMPDSAFELWLAAFTPLKRFPKTLRRFVAMVYDMNENIPF